MSAPTTYHRHWSAPQRLLAISSLPESMSDTGMAEYAALLLSKRVTSCARRPALDGNFFMRCMAFACCQFQVQALFKQAQGDGRCNIKPYARTLLESMRRTWTCAALFSFGNAASAASSWSG